MPKRSIGDTTVNKLAALADELDCSIFDVLEDIENSNDFNAATKTRLAAFRDLIKEFSLNQNSVELSEFVPVVLELLRVLWCRHQSLRPEFHLW